MDEQFAVADAAIKLMVELMTLQREGDTQAVFDRLRPAPPRVVKVALAGATKILSDRIGEREIQEFALLARETLGG
jgi:hypothetical protein